MLSDERTAFAAASDHLVVESLGAGVLDPFSDLKMRSARCNWKGEQGAHAAPHDERVVDINGMTGNDDSLSAKGICGAYRGAEVSGATGSVKDNNQTSITGLDVGWAEFSGVDNSEELGGLVLVAQKLNKFGGHLPMLFSDP
jgi:hypothetical protein